jgi:hypothetical protein
MSRSSNGWPVLTSSADPKLTVIRIPDTGRPGIPLRLHKDCAAVLAYVASRVHKEVSDLHENNKAGKFQDEGGYNYRKIAGTTRFSNHASGTAMDLNWQKWPMFKRRMTKKQRAASEAIALDVQDVIRWGGNYSPARVDEMHWEIQSGVSAADLRKFMKAKGIKKDGTVGKARSPKQEALIQQCRAI